MTSKRQTPSAESMRDEHLLAALRHVPDHDATAPVALGARIRAEAHRTLAAAAASEKPRFNPASDAVGLRTASSRFNLWLTQWFGRPYALAGAGTGMAGLLVATVLWVGRDEWPQQAQHHRPIPTAPSAIQSSSEVPASDPARMSESVSLAEAAPSHSPADKAVRQVLRGKAAEPDSAHTVAAPSTPAKGQPPASVRQDNATPQVPPPSGAQRRLATPNLPRTGEATSGAPTSTTTALPATAALPAAPETMATAPTSPAVIAAAPSPGSPSAVAAPVHSPAASARREDAPPIDRTGIPATVARSAGPQMFSQATPGAPTTALSTVPWLRLTASRATHWQLGEGTPQALLPVPHGTWLAALAQASSERDREIPSPQAADALNAVQLSVGGTTIGRLWLTGSRLQWCDEQGRCREADIEPARMQELLAALPR